MTREKFGEVKLDFRDKKLLFELDFNARQSISQLAKKLGLSKQGVEYKIQRLVKEGVIAGFHPIINMRKIGYIYCNIFFSLRNANFEKEKEILDYLKNSNFFWVISTQGKYDFGAAIWVKSVMDFKQELNKLYENFGEFIENKNETVATDVIYFQARYLLGINKTREIHTEETSEIVEIDKLDRQIIRLLSKDARMPLVRIAETIEVDPKVVSYRIKKLEEKKVIVGYRIEVNHNKLGFTWYKLWINSRKNSRELFNTIKNHPSVLYVVKGIGMPADLDIELMVKESQDLYNFIHELRNKFPEMIGSYESLIMNKAEKEEYVLV